MGRKSQQQRKDHNPQRTDQLCKSPPNLPLVRKQRLLRAQRDPLQHRASAPRTSPEVGPHQPRLVRNEVQGYTSDELHIRDPDRRVLEGRDEETGPRLAGGDVQAGGGARRGHYGGRRADLQESRGVSEGRGVFQEVVVCEH